MYAGRYRYTCRLMYTDRHMYTGRHMYAARQADEQTGRHVDSQAATQADPQDIPKTRGADGQKAAPRYRQTATSLSVCRTPPSFHALEKFAVASQSDCYMLPPLAVNIISV